MYIVKNENGKTMTLRTEEIKSLSLTPTARKIISALAENPSYPKEIARHLRIHEQKVYYYVRKMEKKGIIKVVSREEHNGVIAKIYDLAVPSFCMNFGKFQEMKRIPAMGNKFLEPFIENGKLGAKIVAGSPDPHGPELARSRDAYYAIDLGLFLGTFLNTALPCVNLDTDMRAQDLRNNLIVIGGPVINRVTKSVNKYLPIKFDEKKRIHSTISGKRYDSDYAGFIVKMQNPYDSSKKILVIAGKRYYGTRAAILAFMKKFDDIERSKKNSFVVEGVDEDGDGIVDNVRILE